MTLSREIVRRWQRQKPRRSRMRMVNGYRGGVHPIAYVTATIIVEKFPVRPREFPVLSQKFPAPMTREFAVTARNHWTNGDVRFGNRPRMEKIPVLFPVSREFRSRDRFDRNCVRYHAFLSVPKVSNATPKAPNLRAFAGLRAAKRRLCQSGQPHWGILRLLSLPLWKPFPAWRGCRRRLPRRHLAFWSGQPKHRVLFRPFNRRVTQACNADAPRQSAVDGSRDQSWREEGE